MPILNRFATNTIMTRNHNMPNQRQPQALLKCLQASVLPQRIRNGPAALDADLIIAETACGEGGPAIS